MNSKILILFAALALAGCGKSDDPAQGDVTGPVIAGSGVNGMVFAAVNTDPSLQSSKIFYYEFSSGKIHELLGAESGNPALFFTDGRVFLFNRQPGAENFRTFNPITTDPNLAPATNLPDLTVGDPWDVAPANAGKSILVASTLGESLQVLDYVSGIVTTVPTGNLASGQFRPHALYRNGTHIYALHSGVNASGDSDDSQQVYTLDVATDGTVTFADQNPTTGVIDGQKLTSSNPTGFVNRDGAGGATIVGLCARDWGDCTAGADTLAGDKVAKGAKFASADVPYFYKNQVIDGPAANFVYAHVQTAQGQNKIVKIDVQTKAVTDIHTFADDRLYGMAYDKGSRTLFVGGATGIKGSVTLYRDDKLAGSFDVNGVLYSAAFVPN